MGRRPSNPIGERVSRAAWDALVELGRGQLEASGESISKLGLRLFSTIGMKLEERAHERLEVGDWHSRRLY
jgi:hypothetical protein